MIECYRLVIFVPEDDLEQFISNIQDSIPSFIGNYDRVMWWNNPKIEYGTGQFRPLEGARPAEGQIGTTERITDIRVEFLIPQDDIILEDIVENAIKPAHPYEEPVIYSDHVDFYNRKS